MKSPNLNNVEQRFLQALRNRVDPLIHDTIIKEFLYNLFYQPSEEDEGEWVTVVSSPTDSGRVFGVFFGDTFAYIVKEPTQQFYEDLRRRRVASIQDAVDRY